MSWRVLFVAKPCKLAVKNKQLFYEPFDENDEKITLPLEDISVIVLENKQISLNNALIAEFAEFNIVCFTCDATHTPSGIFMPFNAHSRYSEIAWEQINTTEACKKRLWQKIIISKIINQAEVLQEVRADKAKKLIEISKTVQSGDAKNAESYSANIYWSNIFDDKFKRHNEDIKNAALNYGYAIIRGAIARAVVASGLIPCFGIHHSNKLNPFNLADDLIEPFRPFVDWLVLNLKLEENLTTQNKQELVAVLTKNCSFNNEEITILKAIELSAQSLTKAIKSNDFKLLELPCFSKLPLFAG